jgi:hypothetical protein
MRPVHVVAALWLIQTVTILVAPPAALAGIGLGWVLITAVLSVLALRRPLSWWIATCMAWQAIATVTLVAGLATAPDLTAGFVIVAVCQVGLLVGSWVALSPHNAIRR